MTKKNILSAILLCFLPLILFSQKTISGEVIDENNLPLLGANVIVKDSNKGTVTDFDGKDFDKTSKNIFISNDKIHNELIKILLKNG